MTRLAEWQIEAPSTDDAAALSALGQSSFRTTFADQPYIASELSIFLDHAMGAMRFAARIADDAFALRVARGADGVIIGFITLGPNDLPLPPTEDRDVAMTEVHQLYVADAAKGIGVADALMAWAIDEARSRGAAVLYLSVFVENHRAKAFYARHGFAEVGCYDFHVGSVIDDDRVWKLTL